MKRAIGCTSCKGEQRSAQWQSPNRPKKTAGDFGAYPFQVPSQMDDRVSFETRRGRLELIDKQGNLGGMKDYATLRCLNRHFSIGSFDGRVVCTDVGGADRIGPFSTVQHAFLFERNAVLMGWPERGDFDRGERVKLPCLAKRCNRQCRQPVSAGGADHSVWDSCSVSCKECSSRTGRDDGRQRILILLLVCLSTFGLPPMVRVLCLADDRRDSLSSTRRDWEAS